MLTRPIPSTGEMLPVIGLGTWQTFDVGDDRTARSQLRAVLDEFVVLGGSVVDSSPMYGSSEQVVGDLAAELYLRPKLFVATKVWTIGMREGISQMHESMRKLRAAPVDLMQVHNLLDVNTHLDTLDEWKQQKRIRYTGVTHYTPSAHDAVVRVIESRRVDFVQINYSVAEREAEQRVLPAARDRGVAVIVNRPFASGGLLRRLDATPVPSWAAEIDCDSWSQLLLKFIVSHPDVTCVIPATSDLGHVRDNLRAADWRLPDPELRERIAKAAREA
ncbi:MAG: aldo/keto reductase [Gemmatimonadaceae bacterium]